MVGGTPAALGSFRNRDRGVGCSLKLGEQSRGGGRGEGNPAPRSGSWRVDSAPEKKYIFTRKWYVVVHFNALFLGPPCVNQQVSGVWDGGIIPRIFLKA